MLDPVERLLDRFEWPEGDPSVGAGSAAAALVAALPDGTEPSQVARGFIENDAAFFALAGPDLLVARHLSLRTHVQRVPLDRIHRVARSDENRRIVLEIEGRGVRLRARLVPERACEDFVAALTAPFRPEASITYENYLGRLRSKGNV